MLFMMGGSLLHTNLCFMLQYLKTQQSKFNEQAVYDHNKDLTNQENNCLLKSLSVCVCRLEIIFTYSFVHCQIDILLSFILSCIDTVNEMKKVVLRLQSWSSSYKVLALTPFYLKSHKYVSLMQCYLKSIIADKSHLMSANDRSQNTCFKMNG